MSKKEHGCGDAKWRALVDDAGVSMPRQFVSVAVIRAQASVGDDFVLVRDHNSSNDVVLNDEGTVDLRDGNVFYTLQRCDVQPRSGCHEPAKLAINRELKQNEQPAYHVEKLYDADAARRWQVERDQQG